MRQWFVRLDRGPMWRNTATSGTFSEILTCHSEMCRISMNQQSAYQWMNLAGVAGAVRRLTVFYYFSLFLPFLLLLFVLFSSILSLLISFCFFSFILAPFLVPLFTEELRGDWKMWSVYRYRRNESHFLIFHFFVFFVLLFVFIGYRDLYCTVGSKLIGKWCRRLHIITDRATRLHTKSRQLRGGWMRGSWWGRKRHAIVVRLVHSNPFPSLLNFLSSAWTQLGHLLVLLSSTRRRRVE